MPEVARKKISRSPDKHLLRVRTEKNSLGALKKTIVMALIFLQIAVTLMLYFLLAQVFAWYLLASAGLSICTAVATLSSRRSPSSKAVWVFVILVFFYVGFILALMSDERVYFRSSKRRFAKVFAHAKQYNNFAAVPEIKDARVQEDCTYLKKAGDFACFVNTRQHYFPSGGLLFDDLLARLEEARSFVFIESFILADGVLLARILRILEQKAKAGVDVRIIYDSMGSHGTLKRKTKQRMRACGIALKEFNKLLPVFNIGLNIRDHRKLVVIDGTVAYTGGANIADEYTNETRRFGYWKDEGLRLEGEAVDGITLLFLRQWDYLCGTRGDYAPYFRRYDAVQSDAVTVPFACGLEYEERIAKELYLNVFAKAQHKLYIMTPYFVPDDSIMNVLANKAASGVDVRLLLPGVPDKAFVYLVTKDNARRLLQSGVKVYLMRDSFVHSKTVLSDYCAVVGSINVDMRSFYQQLESAVYTNDPAVTDALAADFENAFQESTRMEDVRQKLPVRIVNGILKIVSPLM